MEIEDYIVGTIPFFVIFGVSLLLGGVSSSAGSSVKARPPPAVFSIVWFILTWLTGISWTIATQENRADRLLVDIIFSCLVLSCVMWLVFYCYDYKQVACWNMVVTVALALTASKVVFLDSLLASCLLTPLVAWLSFASVLSIMELQNEFRTTLHNQL